MREREKEELIFWAVFMFWVTAYIVILTIFTVVVFKIGVHKQNTENLQSNKYITAYWEPERKGQEYTLKHGDWVFFWKSDEKQVRVGMVYVLWGYYRIIAHKDGMTEFRDVEWCNANF